MSSIYTSVKRTLGIRKPHKLAAINLLTTFNKFEESKATEKVLSSAVTNAQTASDKTLEDDIYKKSIIFFISFINNKTSLSVNIIRGKLTPTSLEGSKSIFLRGEKIQELETMTNESLKGTDNEMYEALSKGLFHVKLAYKRLDRELDRIQRTAASKISIPPPPNTMGSYLQQRLNTIRQQQGGGRTRRLRRNKKNKTRSNH